MLIGLHVVFMSSTLYQHLNCGISEGVVVAWLLIAEVRAIRAPAPS